MPDLNPCLSMRDYFWVCKPVDPPFVAIAASVDEVKRIIFDEIPMSGPVGSEWSVDQYLAGKFTGVSIMVMDNNLRSAAGKLRAMKQPTIPLHPGDVVVDSDGYVYQYAPHVAGTHYTNPFGEEYLNRISAEDNGLMVQLHDLGLESVIETVIASAGDYDAPVAVAHEATDEYDGGPDCECTGCDPNFVPSSDSDADSSYSDSDGHDDSDASYSP